MSDQRVVLNDSPLDSGVVNEGGQRTVMASQDMEHLLLAALKRLSSAALARDATMGDPCRLVEVRAELADANRQAMAAIAAARA